MPQAAPASPDRAVESHLLRTPCFVVGRFDCPAEDPRWRRENRIAGGHHVVFPATSVRITHAGGRPVVADPNQVMFYNDGQVFTRALLSERGDRCAFLVVAPALLADVAGDLDPALAEREDAPFPFAHGPCPARSYLLHRRLVQHLARGGAPDALWLEESLVHLTRAVLVPAYRASAPPRRGARASTRAAHAEAAAAAQALLSRRFREPLCLSDVARAIGLSMYHLARVFKERTGLTLHAYRDQLRLRASLEPVAEGRADLTELALDLGYSSHSHFTDAFRRAFGAPPRALRRAATAAELLEMSKILEA